MKRLASQRSTSGKREISRTNSWPLPTVWSIQSVPDNLQRAGTEELRNESNHLKLELRAEKESSDTWYTNVLFSHEQALLFAYMIYYSRRECTDARDEMEAWKKKYREAGGTGRESHISERPELESASPTVLGEAIRNTDPIGDLISELDELAPRPVASERAEAERWLSDFEAYTRARMRNVRPLPQNLRPSVEKALNQWHERESRFLGNGGGSEFLRWTAQTIGENSPPSGPVDVEDSPEGILTRHKIEMVGEHNARTHTVPNIDWVHAFAWILPLADPQNAVEYGSIGGVMATIMCCEAILKWPESVAKFKFLRSVAAESNGTASDAILREAYRRANMFSISKT
jgi:hypothetical protein